MERAVCLGVRTLGLAVGLSAVGCAGEPVADDDSPDPPGVEVVESSAPAWDETDRLRVASSPRVSIGGADEDEGSLFRVVGSVVLSDGRIAIANSGSAEIRFYSPDGTFLSAAGGEGDGPGEFSFLLRLSRTAGDTLIAWDAGAGGRLSRFAPDGEFVESFELDRMGEDGITQYLGTFVDGSHVGQATDFPDPSTFVDGAVVEMGDDTYWLFDRDGTAIRELAAVPLAPRFVRTFEDEGRTGASLSPIPFRRGPQVAMGPTGLRVARTGRFEVRDIGRDGEIRWVARFGAERRRLTEGDVDEYIAAGDQEPSARRIRVAEATALPPPEFWPTARDLVVDAAGRAWIRPDSPDEDAEPWIVVDRDGVWLGSVSFPPGFFPQEIGGGYAIGVWRDELGVEHVQLFDLVGGES